jgi:hypothetical protein
MNEYKVDALRTAKFLDNVSMCLKQEQRGINSIKPKDGYIDIESILFHFFSQYYRDYFTYAQMSMLRCLLVLIFHHSNELPDIDEMMDFPYKREDMPF